MRQTLHIFKKDVRHLWFEIVVVLFAVAGFTFTEARRALWLADPGTNRIAASTLLVFLLPLAWWMLIARVVHEEPLPGDRQFWLTRPYFWRSLLAAKALFILVSINMPMLAADAVIVHAYGLSIRSELPGLFWSQVLLTVAFILPITALAALTTGFVQLIFAILTVSMIALIMAIVAPQTVLTLGFSGGSEWIKSYYAFTVMVVAALAILTWQYSRRRTTSMRSLAVVAGIFVVAGIALIPWSVTFKIQSWLSKQRLDQSLVQVDSDSSGNGLVRAVVGRSDRVGVRLPLQIKGLPPGTSAKLEGFDISFQSPDGAVWRAEQQSVPFAGEIEQEFSLMANLDHSFYEKVKDKPLRVHGSLYLTLFGDKQSARVSFGDHPVIVPRVGACSARGESTGQSYFLICYVAFRYPSVLVTYRFLQVTKDEVQEIASHTQPRPISYSPFPAELGISPMSQDLTFGTASATLSEAIVDTMEPRAYIQREFEINDLRLEDSDAQLSPIAR
jgi:hypothetical protein